MVVLFCRNQSINAQNQWGIQTLVLAGLTLFPLVNAQIWCPAEQSIFVLCPDIVFVQIQVTGGDTESGEFCRHWLLTSAWHVRAFTELSTNANFLLCFSICLHFSCVLYRKISGGPSLLLPYEEFCASFLHSEEKRRWWKSWAGTHARGPRRGRRNKGFWGFSWQVVVVTLLISSLL